jgi:alkylation response protein AidB-like acyl-CoA dehydrogenase
MDLALSSDQKSFRESVESFVARHAPRDSLVALNASGTSWKPEWYAHYGRAGWLGAAVPEALGGAELDPLTLVLLCEELGKAPVPSPFLASSIVGALLLRACVPVPGRDAVLSGIADGSCIVAPALRMPGRSWRGVCGSPIQLARGTGKTFVLDGTSLFVPYADAATHLLVSVRPPDEGKAAFALLAADSVGVTRRKLQGLINSAFEVTFESVTLDGNAIFEVDPVIDVDDEIMLARLAICGYQIGGSANLVDRSIEYSNEREQFGMPIGRFQRVQDHIIEALNALDSARWITYHAAWSAERDRPDAAVRAYLAQAAASTSYLTAANSAHEVFAGIASDPASGITLHTEMSRTLYDLLGSPDWAQRRASSTLDWATA